MRRRILTVLLAAGIPVAAACSGSSNNATQSGAGVAQSGEPAKVDKAADEAAPCRRRRAPASPHH